MDDVADFGRMETAMRQVGLSDTEITDIFRVVAGVLHLGNIEFDQSAGAEGYFFELYMIFDLFKLL